MIQRLAQLGLNYYMKSPGRSWVITTVATVLLRMVRSTVGRRELIDISSIKPGEMIIIEHLAVSHEQQIKDEKKSKRQARRDSLRKKRRARRSDG